MRKFIFVMRYLILVSILMFGTWYVFSNWDKFASRANFSFYNISAIIVFSLLTIACESLRVNFQIKKIGHHLGFRNAWQMFTIIQALNHVFVKAGTMSVGYYMSKEHNFSFRSYLAVVLTYVAVIVLGSGIFGMMVSLAFLAAGKEVNSLILLFFGSIIIGTLAFVSLAKVPVPKKIIPMWIKGFVKAWKDVYSDHVLLLKCVSVEIFYALFSTLRFMAAMNVFSGSATLLESATVLTVGNFLRIASIVPGGLGIAEVASGWTAGMMGYDVGISALAAGLDRAIYVMLIMLFGGLGFFRLTGTRKFEVSGADGQGVMVKSVILEEGARA